MKKILLTIIFLFLPSFSFAATVNFGGGEMSSGSLGDWRASGGTVSFTETGTKESGGFSMRTNPTTTAVGWFRLGSWSATGAAGDFSVTTAYVCAAYNAGTLPASLNEEIFESLNGGSARKMSSRITSAGQIIVYDKDTLPLATSSTSLSTGTWYRLCWKVPNGTSAGWEMRISSGDTVLETMSGTGNFLANNAVNVSFGKIINQNGNTVNYYWDNAVVDDTAYPAGTSIVLLQKPNANGGTQQWLMGTNSSDFNEVDEIPSDSDTTYVKSTGVILDLACFNVQDAATVGITGTISSVKASSIIREDAAGTSSYILRLRSGASDSDTTGSDPGTSYTNRQKVVNTDPATSVAWTLSGVDGVQVCGLDNGTLAPLRMTMADVNVLFTPATASVSTGTSSDDSQIIDFAD